MPVSVKLPTKSLLLQQPCAEVPCRHASRAEQLAQSMGNPLLCLCQHHTSHKLSQATAEHRETLRQIFPWEGPGFLHSSLDWRFPNSFAAPSFEGLTVQDVFSPPSFPLSLSGGDKERWSQTGNHSDFSFLQAPTVHTPLLSIFSSAVAQK